MMDLNRMLVRGSGALHRAAFGCAAGVVVLSPWCFGSWEMWWFWPMTTLLFLASLLAGVGTLLQSAFTLPEVLESAPPEGRVRSGRPLAVLLVSSLPFLVYAAWRATRPSAPGYPLVEMEAERSLLLFATPVLLVATLFLTATRRRIRLLAALLLGNAVVVAVYACANHWITHDTYVLWVETPFNYGRRAGGVFFCPNHLAAYLNLALCLVVAVFLRPGCSGRLRAGLALMAVPLLLAWYLTLSRGGLASLVLVFPLVITLGLRGHAWKPRLVATLVLLLLVGGGSWVLLTRPNPFLERVLQNHFIRTVLNVRETGWEPVRRTFFRGFDRGQYIDSALRAWRSNPRIGIGPGQHSPRWPQFAATEDGDRETGKWPTLSNHAYHLYEVHSDWIQLLEEYGLIGLMLFGIPFVAVLVLLLLAQQLGLRRGGDAWDQGLPLAALLALAVFSIHSLGDFSLQIPSIVWNLAALVACGLLATQPSADTP